MFLNLGDTLLYLGEDIFKYDVDPVYSDEGFLLIASADDFLTADEEGNLVGVDNAD